MKWSLRLRQSSLRSKLFRSICCTKVGARAKEEKCPWRKGGGGESFSPHSFANFLDELPWKRLLYLSYRLREKAEKSPIQLRTKKNIAVFYYFFFWNILWIVKKSLPTAWARWLPKKTTSFVRSTKEPWLYSLPRRGYSWQFLVGCAARFSKSWPYFRPTSSPELFPQKMGGAGDEVDFRLKRVIFHTRFQTRPLKPIPVFRTWPSSRNYVILS